SSDLSESQRRRLAELSPITQRTASMMLDLPQPLGPTTPVMLVGRCNVVGSTKDLNPDSLNVDRRMRKSVPLGWCSCGATVLKSGILKARKVVNHTMAAAPSKRRWSAQTSCSK